MARHQGSAYCNEAIPDAVLTDDLALLLPLEPPLAVRNSPRTPYLKRGRGKLHLSVR